MKEYVHHRRMGNGGMPASIEELEHQLRETKAQLAVAYRSRASERVENYAFLTCQAEQVTLGDLFGEHDDLIVVHNMGRSCPYCTMWADGFNGLLPHLEDRASFVVCTPDDPVDQHRFAASRGWRFDLVTPVGSFTEDMGFASEDGYHPGVTTFHRRGDASIVRVASRRFGPHDDFCPVWPIFDLLYDGIDDWTPAFSYAASPGVKVSPHIAIDVPDRSAATAFYRDVLGMTIQADDGTETTLTCGDTTFYLQEASSPQVYLEFETADLESLRAQLSDCSFEETALDDGRGLMVTDPFGVRYHLFERTAP